MKYHFISFLLILCYAVKLTQAFFRITSERDAIITVGDTNDVSDDAATIEKHDSSGGIVTKQQSQWLLHLFNMMIEVKQRLQESVIKRSFGKLKESDDNGNNVDSLPMQIPVSDAAENIPSDEGNKTAGADSHMEVLQSVLMLVMLVLNVIILVTVLAMMVLHKCRDDDDFRVIAIDAMEYNKV